MMFRFTRRHERPADVERVWAACSVLLDYPTQALVTSLDQVEALVLDREQLAVLMEHLRTVPLRDLQEEYVATFDHTRKCVLYLTYFSYGDTRRRGMALVQFKQAYRKAGVEWDEHSAELPDHLCAVLQFGATVDPDTAWRLLLDHRAGLEMLRLALAGWERSGERGIGSPWLAAVSAVCDTLPTLHGDEAEAVRRLVAQGPPMEEVGLEPYGTDPIIARSIPVGVPR
jgi:nitrate reductase delta subunit